MLCKSTSTLCQVPNKNPLFMMEEEQKEHVAKLNKMEREMEEVFERKVMINSISISFSNMYNVRMIRSVRRSKSCLTMSATWREGRTRAQRGCSS